jgi:hypothetical protein
MKLKFLKRVQTLFSNTYNSTISFLVKKYGMVGELFTPASPFGQILEVLHDLYTLTIFYTEDSITQLIREQSERPSAIYTLAQLAGHDPYLGACSKGRVRIVPKLTTDSINVIIPERLKFIVTGTNLVFTCTNKSIKIDTSTRELYLFDAVQGQFVSQTLIANGEELQSYNLILKRNLFIDDDLITVSVNGVKWDLYQNLYDIPAGKNGVIVKTGMNGGLDIYFGNNFQGNIPPDGALIRVEYIEHSGSLGNISKKENLQLEFVDSGFDELGNEIDLNEIFELTIDTDFVFGTESESIQFTKAISNKGGMNKALINKDQYVYFFEKMNYFSYINVFNTFDDDNIEDDNIYYCLLIPDLKKKLRQDVNYFTTDIRNFYLDSAEKDRLISTINASKIQLPGTEICFIDPVFNRYVINIYLVVYESTNESNSIKTIKANIIDKLSQYFLYNRRTDRIPKSDLIGIIESIDGVDSVSIEFISKLNEESITSGFYTIKNKIGRIIQEQKIFIENEDPNLGLDDLGDIIIGDSELPLIRGGFYDRFGQWYEDTYSPNKLGPVNIFVRNVTERTVNSEIGEIKIKELKNNGIR